MRKKEQELLSCLVQESADFVTSRDLSKRLSLSEKTIRTLIKQLNDSWQVLFPSLTSLLPSSSGHHLSSQQTRLRQINHQKSLRYSQAFYLDFFFQPDMLQKADVFVREHICDSQFHFDHIVKPIFFRLKRIGLETIKGTNAVVVF